MANPSQTLIDAPEQWPALPLEAWQDTCVTLQMWLQIVGKLRMSLSPAQNHWWHVPFYVSSRGLTTSPVPHAGRVFEVEFDFCRHNVRISTSDGMEKFLPLYSRSVADFYRELMGALSAIGVEARIWPMPVECPNPIPFPKDTQHATYDPEYAHRFWRALTSADSLFKEFRIRESHHLQFRWEIFNFFNTPQFAGPNATFGDAAFGRITTTTIDNREMQFALKYSF